MKTFVSLPSVVGRAEQGTAIIQNKIFQKPVRKEWL